MFRKHLFEPLNLFGKIVEVILDNYAVHKHPKVRAWLDRHPRFTFFTSRRNPRAG